MDVVLVYVSHIKEKLVTCSMTNFGCSSTVQVNPAHC
jgi:hypothetical protein